MNSEEVVRILYMEDDAGLARLFQRRLQRSGYEVDIAPDGQQGLAMHEAKSYHGLIVDHKMPVKNGLEVIRELASRGPLPPTIMITGQGDESVAVEAMKLGATDYIIKDVAGRYLELIPIVIGQALTNHRLLREREEAQKALREQERMLRLIINAIPACITYVDSNQVYHLNNRTYEKWFGVPIEEIRGRHMVEVLGQDAYSREKDYVEAALTGKEVRFQTAVTSTDGTQRELSVHYVPHLGDEDEVRGFVALSTDITEMKRTQEELRTARDLLELRVEERTAELAAANRDLRREIGERIRAEEDLQHQHKFLRDVLESLAHPLCVIDIDRHAVLMANSAANPSQAGETPLCHQLAHGLDQPCASVGLNCPRETVAGTGRPITVEHAYPDEDGNLRYHEIHAYPLRDKEGRTSQMIEYWLDVTDRKAAEIALRKSEERFRAIFETAQDCIFVKNLTLTYTHVNPAFEQLLEQPASRIVGRRDSFFFSEETARHMEEVERRVLAGQLVEQENTRLIRGMLLTFHDIRVPMRSASGEIIGLCGISRDITDRKQLLPHSAQTLQGENYPSAVTRQTLSKALLAAKTDTTVLLLGESGSGKDYLARFIHEHSSRRDGPYFAINCAAVAPELAEAELFGHEAGAFTGALGRKRGLLELAEGGTLLLNEIGELELRLQAKLLTFLDTKTVTRVGGETTVPVMTRLIAATNRDLEEEVDKGRFRRDLFFRLNVMALTVPPLRDRMEDLPLLVSRIIEQLAREMQLNRVPALDAGTLNTLASYNWPGNIRELRNVLERALILSDRGKFAVGEVAVVGRSATEWSYTVTFPPELDVNSVADEVKRALVLEALRRESGSRQRASELLGISRFSLFRMMKTLGLEER